MFEKYKDGDLITLKLASGEEVIANYKGNDDSSVSIEKSLVLMQGPQGLAFGTFFSTARQDEVIKIAKAQVEMAKLLVKNGVDAGAKNNNKRRPEKVAKKSGHKSLAKYLKKARKGRL